MTTQLAVDHEEAVFSELFNPGRLSCHRIAFGVNAIIGFEWE
jgi:hypothetical protein